MPLASNKLTDATTIFIFIENSFSLERWLLKASTSSVVNRCFVYGNTDFSFAVAQESMK